MATQLTWADIADFVTEIHAKEGAKPNRSLYRTLGNQALAIISDMARPYHKSWSNAEDGDLTLTDNTVTLPIDCIEVYRVEWDGDENDLEYKMEEWLDENASGWRDDTGSNPAYYTKNGHQIMLDCAPTGTTTGLLTVRGQAYLPEFSDEEDAENPLAFLPLGYQLMPAYYVLANLPFDPQSPVEVARQARYEAMWERDLARLVGAVTTRKYQAVEY